MKFPKRNAVIFVLVSLVFVPIYSRFVSLKINSASFATTYSKREVIDKFDSSEILRENFELENLEDNVWELRKKNVLVFELVRSEDFTSGVEELHLILPGILFRDAKDNSTRIWDARIPKNFEDYGFDENRIKQ